MFIQLALVTSCLCNNLSLYQYALSSSSISLFLWIDKFVINLGGADADADVLQVSYPSLKDEIKIGDYYLRILLEQENNTKEEDSPIRKS